MVSYNSSMLLLYSQLVTMSIFSIQTGNQLGRVAKAIIDPRQFKIVAFYCEGPALDSNPAILHTEDIREVTPNGLVIDSADNIMPPDDLVRLQEVLNFKFELIDQAVVDDAGTKLGKVARFSVETTTFYIMKLHVRPSLLQALRTAEHIVDRTQIIEVTAKNIVVRSPVVKAEQSILAEQLPGVENPFRKHTPQPDTLGERK